MALSKLEIEPLGSSRLKETIKVPFNPNAYAISKAVTWRGPSLPTDTTATTAPRGAETPPTTQQGTNAPRLQFGGGGSRQLTLNLFFDVTEPIGGKIITDVRTLTDKIVALTRIDRDLGHPPTCKVSWGKATTADFPFTGVVSSLQQNFTLFTSDGTPVRADLTVVFTEFLDPEADQHETDPELTTRVVKRGDTLSGLAAEVYRDPTRWRVIAEANRLDDACRLVIGQRLTFPKQ